MSTHVRPEPGSGRPRPGCRPPTAPRHAVYRGIGGLSVGDRVKARVMATAQPIDCGPGEAVILLEVKRVG